MNKTELRYNRLSEIGNNSGIRFSHFAAVHGCHCPMHTALAAIRKIRGVSSLVVGMPECGFYSRYVMDRPVGDKGELHYTYILDSNEVVFGCRDGLKDALHLMVMEGAKAIVVIMTCIPALIGEDIKEITEEINAETKSLAVCIDMAHFKRNGYEDGFYQVYGSLLSLIPVKNRKQEKASNNETVTILGPNSGMEGRELKNILLENGYKVFEINSVFSLEQLELTITASLTLVTSIHFLPLAERLEELYQIPYVFLSGSYSLEAISVLYDEIFGNLHIPVSYQKFQMYEGAWKLLKEKKDLISGADFFITAVLPDVLGLTAFLCSLSMKPLFLHIEEYNKWMEVWKKEILDWNQDPMTVYLVSRKRSAELLEDGRRNLEMNKTLLSFGAMEAVSIKGRSCTVLNDKHLLSLTNLFGYERTFRLLELMIKSLEENEHAVV